LLQGLLPRNISLYFSKVYILFTGAYFSQAYFIMQGTFLLQVYLIVPIVVWPLFVVSFSYVKLLYDIDLRKQREDLAKEIENIKPLKISV
jgi:hypothetical protein